jgi:outer membrane receptor for ferrienterochelin and colicin
MKSKLFLSIFMLIGCASNGAERKPMRPRNFISQEEIKEHASARTVKEVIETARPLWLRGKGLDASVYINGIKMGNLDQLDNVSIQSVKNMRYIPNTEATTMYGTNNMGGVIEIKSK